MTYTLTVQEAAELLGVSAARVYQLINSHALAAERIGRTWVIDDASVQARSANPHPAGRPSKSTRYAGAHAKPYLLMNREHVILEFSYDPATHRFNVAGPIVDPSRAPLGLVSPRRKKVSNDALSYWWRHRAIPATRAGIETRLAELGLESVVDMPFRNLGLSLSDQYWVKPQAADIDWKDINYFDNDFDDPPHTQPGVRPESWMQHAGLDSPDNTSEGELPKCWRIEHNTRELLKGSGLLGQEPYNELIATRLFKRLLNPTEFVPYHLTSAFGEVASACPCFIGSEEEYIPAYYVRQTMRKPNHLNDYRHYIECCVRLGIENAEDTLTKMVVCDDFLANHDRHWRNFGLIRNVETLEYRVAPLFDTGSSLWCDVPTVRLIAGDYSFATKPFYADANRQLRLADDYSWIDFEALEDFDDVVAETLAAEPAFADRAVLIAQGVRRRIDRLQRLM